MTNNNNNNIHEVTTTATHKQSYCEHYHHHLMTHHSSHEDVESFNVSIERACDDDIVKCHKTCYLVAVDLWLFIIKVITNYN